MKITIKTTRNRLYNGVINYAEKSSTDAKKRSNLKLEVAMELFREMLQL